MPVAAPDFLDALNYQRELLAQQGMGLLGAWALLNLVISGWWVAQAAPRSEAYFFHQMNVLWNVVNALLAMWGILQAAPLHVAGLSVADSLRAQYRFEEILLLNIGLDVAYITAGFWLRARATPAGQPPQRLQGFGRALWLQGGFLLVFDAGLFGLYHRFAEPLLRLL